MVYMHDSQIFIPDAFIRLFAPEGKQHLDVSTLMSLRKLTQPADVIAQRFETAEDMAHLLSESAKNTQFRLQITESDVIDGTLKAISSEDALAANGMSDAEARWTVARMAEINGWSEYLPQTILDMASA